MKRTLAFLPVLASVVAIASCSSRLPADDDAKAFESAHVGSTSSALTSGGIVSSWHDDSASGCVCTGVAGGGYSRLFTGQTRSKSFADPVPAGSCVTGVSVTFLGTQCSLRVGFRLNGTDLGLAPSASSGCSCGDCSGGTITVSAPSGLAGYVYGGTNTLLAYNPASGYSYVSQTTTTLSYETVTATMTTLVSATNPAAFGQSVTLSAHVGASAGTPAGSVTFSEGATTLGSGSVNAAGDATFTTSALAVGRHDITATYVPGSCGFTASASTTLSQVVSAATTKTGIAVSQSTTVVGGNVTVTATVAPVSPGAGVPTGTVTFLDGATTLGSSSVDGAGHATYATTGFAVGDHGLTAAYSGTSSFTSSTSTTTTVTVSQDTGSTALVADTNPSTFGGAVTFTATVSSGATGGVPTGHVVFKDGATTLDTVSLVNGVATYRTSALAGGSHTITASYGGDANHAAAQDSSVVEVVNVAATATALASSVNPAKHGQSITLTATPTSPVAGTVDGTVTFTEGATLLGTSAVVGGTATLSTAALSTGAHDIVATYSGNGNFGMSSSTVTTETVDPSSTTTTLVASANPSLFSRAVTFTATVGAVLPGAGTPIGAVTFKDGATTLGTATLANGVATYATSTLLVGAHSITAVYGATTNHAASTSTSLSQAVNANAASAELLTSPNPSIITDTVTLTATFGGDVGTPTGSIAFVDETDNAGTALGSANLVGGVATISVATLAVGNHTLVARFPGDSAYAAANASAAHVVGKAASATAVSSSANPSVFASPPVFTATVTAAVGGVSGSVDFYDGATKLGTSALDASGATTFQSPSMVIGGHFISALYTGDSLHLGSSSPAYLQSITPASMVPVPDAGSAVSADASIAADAGTTTTVPAGSVATTPNVSLSGAGCSFGGASTTSGFWALAGIGSLVFVRARRRRSRSSA